jgi:hypothetical protein
MMRDVNPTAKTHGKPHSFVGEQPRKFHDKGSKFSKHKHADNSSFQDMDNISRDRHIYHRAASKNMTREILRSNQF